VPAPLAGAWVGRVEGERGGPFRLQVKQRFQHFEGELVRNARVAALRDATIDGSSIRFSAPGPDGRLEVYTGTVQDGTIAGEARSGAGTRIARWSAARAQ
jgi:hypothetical protein